MGACKRLIVIFSVVQFLGIWAIKTVLLLIKYWTFNINGLIKAGTLENRWSGREKRTLNRYFEYAWFACLMQRISTVIKLNKKLIRRWDSERELSLRQRRIHALQNTIDSCINSATDRRCVYVLIRRFTKVSEITQCNGHYAVQGHSRSPILVPIESSYTT